MPLRNAVTCALTTALILSSSAMVKADLPKALRESTTADTQRGDIDKYVAGLVTKIIAKDPKAGQFRDELAGQCNTTPTITSSPSFKLVYVGSVVPALAPLLKDADPTVRIHAAIVIAKLASSTQAGTALAPVAEQLLSDQSVAIKIWGVKAGGALLQNLFAANINLQNEKLSAAIVTAAIKNPQSGAILQEAYKAFDLTGLTPPQSAAGLCRATERTNEILAARIQLYVAGSPVEPQTDRIATSFLSKGETRNAVKAAPPANALDLKVMQNLLDLTSVSADRANTLSGGDKTKMFKVTEAASGAIFALVDANPAVVTPLKPLMGASSKPPATPANDVKSVLTALTALPAYKNLKNPPAITASTPAPAAPAGEAAGK